ncbi:type I-F CRISPR-associated endoribonuclease Cas6/Csy4 [Halomonas sp. McH1-25]|nr:type I-F CRISPR-associated endoribonuclease Cas6/Csy4 [Halomonas sp. McH1-25]MCP1344697.1 type I-F CRISPR-associated endoribonuclease Cas6/Csy4 [Halomonas sp. FL8]MCP1363291.1 type I-F CRISPR-associated endoribonuclease Cas6/Csy4 [Halomonas sp. BBD45]MCP1364021.1 type I-F CRISPR-associated endoribonuclease Cas6/Csy4 [Halomonas sp. BBD48]
MPGHDRLQYSVLRVFASSRDELDTLIENVRAAKTLREQAIIQYPRSVPEDYVGSWSLYQRFRIPARRSERIPGRSVRLKHIQEAHDQELPFFQMVSESNGGRFRLCWSVVAYEGDAPLALESHPGLQGAVHYGQSSAVT